MRPMIEITEELLDFAAHKDATIDSLEESLRGKDLLLAQGTTAMLEAGDKIEELLKKIADLELPPVDEEPEVEIPPVVVPPTGFLSRPDEIQNMYEPSLGSGEWRTRGNFPSLQVAVLQFRLGQINPGSTIRASFYRNTNIVYGSDYNHKPIRIYKDRIGGYPNVFAGTQVDGKLILYTEKLNPVTGRSRFYFRFPPPTGDWRQEVWEFTYASGVGKADGRVKVTVGGHTILDESGWQSDDATYRGCPNILCLQDVNSSQAGNPNRKRLPSNAYTSFKDIRITVTP